MSNRANTQNGHVKSNGHTEMRQPQSNGGQAATKPPPSENRTTAASPETNAAADDASAAWPVWDASKESFESMPFVTACLTYLGFYLLMLLGLINQLLFTPKVAKEMNREVSTSVAPD